MKKHVISLVMVLATIVMAGTSVYAQDDGMAPSTVKWVIKGSTSTFTVSDNSGSTFAWTVWEHAFAGDDSDAGLSTSSLTDASAKVTIGSAAANSTTIQFFDTPAASNMFAVQCVETDGSSCSTIRRFFINIFDFDVDVALVDDASGSNPNYDNDESAYCNSWSGLVVDNSIDSTELANMHADYTANNPDDSLKYTTSYYAVTISLSNAPSGVTIADYNWRFLYSMPNASDLSIYEISAVTSGPTFAASASATATTALTLSSWADDTWTGNNAVYVPAAATATYIFKVRTHNIMGQSNPMVYDLQIDQVQLEKSSTTAYNNGEKLHANIITDHSLTGRSQLDDGATGTRTINQSPATTVIGIAE